MILNYTDKYRENCNNHIIPDCKIQYLHFENNWKPPNATIVNIIPKQSHRMDLFETLKMTENNLFYNIGGIIGMWFGWSVISFSSFPMIVIRIFHKVKKFTSEQLNLISMDIFLSINIKFQLIFEITNQYLYYRTMEIVMFLFYYPDDLK